MGIAAVCSLLHGDAPPCGKQMLVHSFELPLRFDLDAEVVYAGRGAALRDRKVDSRVVEHPLGVVVLAHGGLGAEQGRIEANALGEIGHCNVNVKALHAALLRFEMGCDPARRGSLALSSDAQDASHPPLAQQFSVRYATRPFIASKLAL